MIVTPKTRGFICTTAHKDGCKANVKRQIDYVKSQPKVENGPKKVLVIGASTGYGLASRISAAFGCGAATIGVIFDKPADRKRTASAGWYNTAAFEEFAAQDGLYAKTINGDAFSGAVKQQVIDLIRQDLGQIDLFVYSLAAPRRKCDDGTTYTSVLKTTGESYTNITVDLATNTVGEVTVEPATPEEVEATVKVMGGEDWSDWVKALSDAGVLAQNAITLAYSYIGPKITWPIYYNGSIGAAKKDLYQTSVKLNEQYKDLGLKAYISVNKALVTQASAAIPVVPLYITILYKLMKQMGIHEGCIEQMYRMFAQKLYLPTPEVDEQGQLRLDDWEMRDDVQSKVEELWGHVTTENLKEYADIDGYWEDFYNMFGFHIEGVDYDKDIDIHAKIPSIPEE